MRAQVNISDTLKRRVHRFAMYPISAEFVANKAFHEILTEVLEMRSNETVAGGSRVCRPTHLDSRGGLLDDATFNR